MTRVAFITSSFPWGEGESFLFPELTELLPLNEMVIVPTWPKRPPPSSQRSALTTRAIGRHPLAPSVVAGAIVEAITRPRAAMRAGRALWGGSPRTRVRNAAALPKALWLARLTRRLDIGHLHAYWASTPASLAMATAAATGLPWSMTAHRGDVTAGNVIGRKVAGARFTRCIATATRDRVLEYAGDCAAGASLPVVSLGIKLPDGRSERRVGEARIMCAARLTPLKRHRDLVVAVDRLRRGGLDVHLDLAGAGNEERRIRKLVNELDMDDRVHFLGHVPHPDLLGRLRQGMADVVVLASEIEGIPVSLMEAMAVGVPVVATNVGGVQELLGGGAGVMVPPRDPAALAGALRNLLTDDDLWERTAAAGRERVRTHFDARASSRRLAELIFDA